MKRYLPDCHLAVYGYKHFNHLDLKKEQIFETDFLR